MLLGVRGVSVGSDDALNMPFAIFEGVVREVYRITGWLDGGSTFNVRRGGPAVQRRGRHEFVGTVADDKVRKWYINRISCCSNNLRGFSPQFLA